ncbi:MAG TPA: hydroxyacid dehydrogenase [Microvirga sp.]|nr:hydroxyacid dehydrogenase [Microvirga sp.]
MSTERPVVLSAPHPRTLDLIFSPEARARLHAAYDVVEAEPAAIGSLNDERLGSVRYILGQPPIPADLLRRLRSLRCVFNVEGNLVGNMPYETLFERGIHVVTTGAVFAEPVAEMGIALALNLARGIIPADEDFRRGREVWGRRSNEGARLLGGSDVGIIGFGDLGRALNRLLAGFRPRVRVYDPWLPPSILVEHGTEPASLDAVLSGSDFVFVMAAVTTENRGFLAAPDFARMREGAALILLSRADAVDFDDLMEAVRSRRIVAASDVFPEEPLPLDHPVRSLDGFIRSAHRAGGLPSALRRMGDMVLEDMDLMDRGLPPMRCKRAERETASRVRSKGVG